MIMKRCGILLLCWLSVSRAQRQDDSLRGALEAVTRRHQDMSAAPPYYIGQPRTSQINDELPYFENQEYGQPEDIGYGYQKSVAPHTAGIFEPIALPSTELGAHEALANNHLPRITERELERLTSDFIGDEPDNSRLLAHRLPNGYKRSSVFREREEPDSWQMADAEPGERMRGPSRMRNALALVRNYGGLDREPEQLPDSTDPDSYLRLLNYVYHKYKAGSNNEFDPEDIGDGDVEDLIEYLGRGENRDRKRSDHNGGYDFFNYPSAWYKRSDQRIDTPQSDGFFHALKFLSGDRDALEAMRNEDAPGEDDDEDVSRLLMEPGPRVYRKRYPAIGGFDDRFSYKGIAKRFPVTKRSLKSSSGPQNKAALTHQTPNNAGTTDPEVAQELDNIFSASGEGHHKAAEQKEQNSSATTDNPKPEQKKKGSELFPEKKEKKDEKSMHSVHRRDKEVAGQKEETNPMDNDARPVEVRKKSVDWSEYFGIDRRRKKSATDSFDDDWLLNQYLKAYSGPKKMKAQSLRDAEMEAKNEIPDDIDGKLRAMEDLIVDEALKYTGANQGLATGDEAQMHKVKERVMSQLAAAYSLEKMRRALGEFKSSINGDQQHKQSPHDIQFTFTSFQPTNQQSSTPPPSSDAPKEEASKRVAVKKEKADTGKKEKKFEKIYQEDMEKNYLPIEKPLLHSVPLGRYYPQKVDSCPILDEIVGHCRQISILSGDMEELFLPLCTLHQTCTICGHSTRSRRPDPDECDMAFMNQIEPVCGRSAACLHSANRMMAGMESRRQRGVAAEAAMDAACNNPCLAPFLTVRRRR
ncbi:uncharacterized protein LOC111059124 [Nilaparvata lugens]|uniref:uncharacterized protein LOC111059124 n=1 Tax=Nilaparvata lugens TaxID=108931 RepID=UPI00193DA7F7|nr:uncharacterized protein LOC111059124 [Nilaparvata lugens]